MPTSHFVKDATTIATHIQGIFTFLLKTHMKRMLWSVSVEAERWVLATWNMEEIRDYGGPWGVMRNRPHLIPGSLIQFLHQMIMTVGVCVCMFVCLFIYLRLGHTFLMLLWKAQKWNHKKQRFWFEKLPT